MMRAILILIFLGMFALGNPGPALAQVGHVAQLQGQAQGPTGPLSVGSPVSVGDVLTTGAETRLKVEFSDQSFIILGDNGRLTIDGLRQDPGHLVQDLSFQAGSFRFVSGQIAHTNRDAVRIITPVASIGIRGTDFFGGPLSSGMPPGQQHYGFMRMDGAIEVVTRFGNATLSHPSEGTFLPLDGGQAPTPPAIWSAEAIAEAYAAIDFR